MKKIINSTGEQFKDILTDELVLDATPTEGSFNSVTSDGVAKAIAAGGGGTEYSAGDGIAISEGEISTQLADGSGLRFDQGGLQIVHQLATPGAADEGKVLTVTNSLGAYAWSDPSGVSSATAPLSVSNGNVSLGMDSDTLETKTISGEVRENYGTGFAGGSPFALAINNTRPITVTFNGITPSADTRTNVGISIAYTEDGYKMLGYGSVTIPANATSVTYSLDVSEYEAWSSGNWRPNDSSRTYDFSMSYQDDDDQWITVPYSYASVPGGETTYELAVKNPLPGSLGTAGQVLTVNSGATGVEWSTPAATVSTTGVITGDGTQASPVALNVGNGLTSRQSTVSGNVDTSTHVLSNSDSIGAAFENGDSITLVFEGVSGPSASATVEFDITDYNGFSADVSTTYDGSGTISLTVEKHGMYVHGTWPSGSTILVNGFYNGDQDVMFTSGSLSAAVGGTYLDVTNYSLLANTAGITDIVSVASLPASPDAHTLYLVTGV